jgi:hypothetical protein
MIRTALEFIKNELDGYIVERENDAASYASGNVVDLASVVLPNGNINIDNNKHITLMMAGIEEERREGKRPYVVPAENNRFHTLNPPVELDLYLLFIAHKTDYETALRDLSDVISFFQANPVFDQRKYPALNAGVAAPDLKPWQLIERLSLRLCNLTFEQQNNLWGMLGGKYIPSAVYKMHMLTIFETKSQDAAPRITEVGILENG